MSLLATTLALAAITPASAQGPGADLAAVMTASDPVAAASGIAGNVDVEYAVTVTNTGTEFMNGVTAIDDLVAQFGAAFVGVVDAPTTDSGFPLGDPSYTGETPNHHLLTANPIAEMSPGDEFTVTFAVELDPSAGTLPLSNTALVGAGGLSVSPEATVEISQLESVKSLVDAERSLATAGAMDVGYKVTVTNTGSTTIDDIQIADDLASQFGSAFVTVVGNPVVTGDLAASRANPGFDGDANVNLLTTDTTESLAPGESFVVTFNLTLKPNDAGAPSTLANAVVVTGEPPTTGPPIIVPPQPPLPLRGEAIDLSKTASAPVDAASGVEGNVDVTYTLTFTNSGTSTEEDIIIADDLEEQFGDAFIGIVSAPVVAGDLNPARANTNFDGTSAGSRRLLTLDDFEDIGPGESFTVTFTAELDPDAETDGFHSCYTSNPGTPRNIVVTVLGGGGAADVALRAFDTAAVAWIDIGDGIPASWQLCDEPVLMTNIARASTIGIDAILSPPIATGVAALSSTKAAGEPVASASGVAGNVDVTYTVTVENTGSEPLDGLVVTDDLDELLGAAFVDVVVDPVVSGDIASTRANTGFDGDGNINLLTANATDAITAGEEFTVTFTVEIDPDAVGAVLPLGNVATTTGVPPTGPPIVITPPPTPTPISQLESVKALDSAGPSAATPNAADVVYTVTVTNTGSSTIDDIQVADDVAGQFGTAFVTIVGDPAVTGDLAATRANTGFDGDVDSNLLTTDPADSLAPGESFVVTFIVTVDFEAAGAPDPLTNEIVLTGVPPVAGPPIIIPPQPPLPLIDSDPTVTKTVSEPVAAASGVLGNVDMTFTVTVSNPGIQPVTDIAVADDLATQFGDTFIGVVSAPSVAGDLVSARANAQFDGVGDTALLTANAADTLEPGESATITFTVEVDPDADLAALPISNVASLTASGIGPIVNPPVAINVPSLFASKNIGAQANAASGIEGNIDVTYQFEVLNNGSEEAIEVNLVDDFQTQFGTAFVGVTQAPTVTNIDATTAPDGNAAYDGSGDLLTGAASVGPDQSFTVSVTVEVDPDAVGAPNELGNVAEVRGTAPTGPIPPRETTPGVVPEGGDPGPVILFVDVEIAGAKEIISVERNTDGTADFAYRITVGNLGNVETTGIQITDDLGDTFGTLPVTIVSATSTDLTVNAGYDGRGDINLLSGTDALAIGQTSAVDFVVRVTVGDEAATFENIGFVSGTGPSGTEVVNPTAPGSVPEEPSGNEVSTVAQLPVAESTIPGALAFATLQESTPPGALAFSGRTIGATVTFAMFLVIAGMYLIVRRREDEDQALQS